MNDESNPKFKNASQTAGRTTPDTDRKSNDTSRQAGSKDAQGSNRGDASGGASRASSNLNRPDSGQADRPGEDRNAGRMSGDNDPMSQKNPARGSSAQGGLHDSTQPEGDMNLEDGDSAESKDPSRKSSDQTLKPKSDGSKGMKDDPNSARSSTNRDDRGQTGSSQAGRKH